LKGIFVPYFGYLLERCAETLNAEPAADQKASKKRKLQSSSCVYEPRDYVLLQFVLSSLHKCFLHDTDGFVDQSRSESLQRPLLQQLDRMDCIPGGVEGFRKFMESAVVPCIAQLAVAVTGCCYYNVSCSNIVFFGHTDGKRKALEVAKYCGAYEDKKRIPDCAIRSPQVRSYYIICTLAHLLFCEGFSKIFLRLWEKNI
jgi:hypothetical protein